MDLASWLAAHHPGRGGRAVLFRTSGCSPDTIRRALAGEPILTRPAAQRLSDATGGVVKVDDLMRGGVRAKPRRKSISKSSRARARRKTSARTAQKAAA